MALSISFFGDLGMVALRDGKSMRCRLQRDIKNDALEKETPLRYGYFGSIVKSQGCISCVAHAERLFQHHRSDLMLLKKERQEWQINLALFGSCS